eukprot:TRINITY_DN10334_c0_g2_i1.p1 TRINITY_DN10334_c0_g2~~TRINITY_DN10334_c0_g2_i1.p1  ORF type:complete len:345 (+),score=113.34 TRINITY_DN10334_c0_g2_i1:168-1202(+)
MSYGTGDEAFRAVTEFRAMLAAALAPLQDRLEAQERDMALLRKRVSELETKQMANAAVSSWAVKEINRKAVVVPPAARDGKGVGIVHQRNRESRLSKATPSQSSGESFKFNFPTMEVAEPEDRVEMQNKCMNRKATKAAKRKAEEAARKAEEAAAAAAAEAEGQSAAGVSGRCSGEGVATKDAGGEEQGEAHAEMDQGPEEEPPAPLVVVSKAAEKKKRQAEAAERRKSEQEEKRQLALEQEEHEIAAAQKALRDELIWCVAQLDAGLLRPDVSPEQERESVKVKKILLNPKTALVKKRCSMNLVFGDYRTLMRRMPSPPAFMVKDAESRVDEMLEKQASLAKH